MLQKLAHDYHERTVRRFDAAIREGDYWVGRTALVPWVLWPLAVVFVTSLIVPIEAVKQVIGLAGIGIMLGGSAYLLAVYLRVSARIRAEGHRELGDV